jgi:transcriptional regulator with XRE-family HTH domain
VSAERSVSAVAVDGASDGDRDGERAGHTVRGASRPEAPALPKIERARLIRARELVAGAPTGQIAGTIAEQCEISRIRAYRLALGIALADVVAQVRARYAADGRTVPRFSETLLSAYESGQKRPGPEYLHYLCAAYQADPADLGYEGRCLCGRSHRPPGAGLRPGRAASAAVPTSAPGPAGTALAPAITIAPVRRARCAGRAH